MKKCPFCAEEIQEEAIKCKHCGSDLSGHQYDETSKKNQNLSKKEDESQNKSEEKTKKANEIPTKYGCIFIILIAIGLYAYAKYFYSASSPNSSNNSNNAKTEQTESLTKDEKKKIKSRLKELKAGMKIEHDQVENMRWYKRQGSENWDEWGVYLYMGEKGSKRWLMLHCGIKESDWIFIDKIIFLADDERYKVPIGSGERKSEVLGNKIKEWVHIKVNKDCYNNPCITPSFLKKIAEADKSIIRFSGKYKKDITLVDYEKKDIEEMIEFYKLKEKLE